MWSTHVCHTKCLVNFRIKAYVLVSEIFLFEKIVSYPLVWYIIAKPVSCSWLQKWYIFHQSIWFEISWAILSSVTAIPPPPSSHPQANNKPYTTSKITHILEVPTRPMSFMCFSASSVFVECLNQGIPLSEFLTSYKSMGGELNIADEQTKSCDRLW